MREPTTLITTATAMRTRMAMSQPGMRTLWTVPAPLLVKVSSLKESWGPVPDAPLNCVSLASWAQASPARSAASIRVLARILGSPSSERISASLLPFVSSVLN